MVKSENKTKKVASNSKTRKMRSNIVHGRIVEKNAGWTVIEIRGNASQRGYAHGVLLHEGLEKVKTALQFIIRENVPNVSYKKYMSDCKKIIVPKIKQFFPEIFQELKSIVLGANAMGCSITFEEVVAWNSYLSMYYLYNKSSKPAKEHGRCSSFIATGKSTKHGEIVMAHNTHCDFLTGQFSNVIMYVCPEKGFKFVMQTAPGFVASGTDWFLCSSGIIGCESTISEISYKAEFGTPFFCRIRQAMQYGKSLDEYVEILMDKNAGDYPCSWFLGDTSTNEIMMFELGLHKHSVQRTTNGAFYGMNTAHNYELRMEETADRTYDDKKENSRKFRLDYLLNDKHFGNIDIECAKKILADHYDSSLKENVRNKRSICAHYELDGTRNNNKHTYHDLYGCVDGKVVDTQLAKKLQFEGRFGSSCGRVFSVQDHIDNHPQYKEWEKYLSDFPLEPWVEIKNK
jgi:hypothetical protein